MVLIERKDKFRSSTKIGTKGILYGEGFLVFVLKQLTDYTFKVPGG